MIVCLVAWRPNKMRSFTFRSEYSIRGVLSAALCRGTTFVAWYYEKWGYGSNMFCEKIFCEVYSWQSLSCCDINIWFCFLWYNYSWILLDRWFYLSVVSEWCYLLDGYCSLRNAGRERTSLFIKFIFMLLQALCHTVIDIWSAVLKAAGPFHLTTLMKSLLQS